MGRDTTVVFVLHNKGYSHFRRLGEGRQKLPTIFGGLTRPPKVVLFSAPGSQPPKIRLLSAASDTAAKNSGI
jgi:hypothetical protein